MKSRKPKINLATDHDDIWVGTSMCLIHERKVFGN